MLTLSTVPIAKGADLPVVAWYILMTVGIVHIIWTISVKFRDHASLVTNHVNKWIGHHLIGDLCSVNIPFTRDFFQSYIPFSVLVMAFQFLCVCFVPRLVRSPHRYLSKCWWTLLLCFDWLMTLSANYQWHLRQKTWICCVLCEWWSIVEGRGKAWWVLSPISNGRSQLKVQERFVWSQ